MLAAVIVLRLVCVTMARSLLFRRDTDVGDRTPSFSHSLVVGWAGMRGVVTLATALLIPPGVEYRETLIFAAMVVTAGTLLLRDSPCRRWYARCTSAARMPAPMRSRPQPFCRPPATPPSMSSTGSDSPAIPTKR